MNRIAAKGSVSSKAILVLLAFSSYLFSILATLFEVGTPNIKAVQNVLDLRVQRAMEMATHGGAEIVKRFVIIGHLPRPDTLSTQRQGSDSCKSFVKVAIRMK